MSLDIAEPTVPPADPDFPDEELGSGDGLIHYATCYDLCLSICGVWAANADGFDSGDVDCPLCLLMEEEELPCPPEARCTCM